MSEESQHPFISLFSYVKNQLAYGFTRRHTDDAASQCACTHYGYSAHRCAYRAESDTRDCCNVSC